MSADFSQREEDSNQLNDNSIALKILENISNPNNDYLNSKVSSQERLPQAQTQPITTQKLYGHQINVNSEDKTAGLNLRKKPSEVLTIMNNQESRLAEQSKLKRLFVPNINIDLKIRQKRTNFLIGAPTSNNFQLPEVWQNNQQLDTNASLVGFQNNRAKVESQKLKRKINTINSQPTNRVRGVNSLNSAQNPRNFIETFNMPLRGRPVTIGDRTREIIMRCDLIKQNYEQQQERLYHDINDYESKRGINTAGNSNNSFTHGLDTFKDRRPLQAKIYNFSSAANSKQQKKRSFIDSTQLFYNSNNPATDSQILDQVKQINLKLPAPTHQESQQILPLKHGDRSFENILRFLDIGKADFDYINRGLRVKGANVVDINKSTEIPLNNEKKKNKNDFYRFLLAQNNLYNGNEIKINNDILIPRSILKKGERRSREGRRSSLNDDEIDAYYSDYDQITGVQGRPLLRNNPLLSPKFNQILNFQHQAQDLKRMMDQNMKPGVATSITPEHLQSKQDIDFPVVKQNSTIDADKDKIKKEDTSDIINIKDDQVEDYNKTGTKDKSNISQEQFQVLNQDLQIESHIQSIEQQSRQEELKQKSEAKQLAFTQQPKKRIIRETVGGGTVFETQVEVIEREVIDENNKQKRNTNQSQKLGEIPEDEAKQKLKELQKQKDDKIFGFNNFNEFRLKYFQKDVNPLESKSRIKQLKDARVKYGKKFTGLINQD
ncbi:UNKNOWN [Stylonychia lemnae]|uniref:Uncharacterized protein n=1 Tax=Stylonychia lemnae TaxID=5949 RepID=A0A077ZSA4_STYLE|nr:UNKNOWN [Stylonychia lemnae]|eukprot:CDW72773.1 UNKNOWN [Stylonychia lemnae]